MQRPQGLTAIASLFALVATYLWVIGAIKLAAPGAISLMAGRHFLYGLELAGPYMMLLGGGVYALVAWGLFRLQNWARWSAMLLIVISTASLIPKISMAELGVPVLWYGLQIALRVAIGWYLAQAPAVIDTFSAKH
ncbi:MAG TPA: hypothetical protein VJP02_24295 [Candidatus Sulfotelmatobacter sp.]|nr:hypothetical protein [Candidatus Sulfotelmatobacter sp.]